MKKQIRRWNKITALLLILTLLLVSVPIAGVSEEGFSTATSSNGGGELDNSTAPTEVQTNPTFSLASEADEITPNPDYDPNYVPINKNGTRSVPTVPSSAPVQNGVYQLRNEDSYKMLHIASTGTESGTVIQQQEESTTFVDRNQLFKITYLHHQNGHYYYSIRPMTNSGLGLHGSTSEEGGVVTAVGLTPDEDFLNIELSMRWEIIKHGSYFLIKNGTPYDGGYLYNDGSLEDGASMVVCQPEEIDGGSMWMLIEYTGDTLEGIYFQNFKDVLLKGEQFKYTACMYSSVAGYNGPVSYRVGNEDYSATDKATINSITGVLTALKPGVIKIGVTYPNAPWIWWRSVTINSPSNMLYMLKPSSSNALLNPASDELNSHILTQAYNANQTSMMWRFIHVVDDFYAIKNEATGYYLRAPASDENNQLITQSTASNVYGLWKFIATNDGHFRIQSRNQYLRETDDPLYLSIISGIVIQSSTAPDNKWDVKPLTLNLNVYYDQAFCDVYDEIGVEPEEAIRKILETNTSGAENYRSIPDFFAEEFGVQLNIQIMDDAYPSYPYTCNCLYKNDPYEECDNCSGLSMSDLEDYELYLDCIDGYHHKSANHFAVCTPQSTTTINILFTGHRPECAYDTLYIRHIIIDYDDDEDRARGMAEDVGSGNRCVVFVSGFESLTNYQEMKSTTTHEILHLLNARHHYNNISDVYCIFGNARQEYYVTEPLSLCDDCNQAVNAYKFKVLYAHN